MSSLSKLPKAFVTGEEPKDFGHYYIDEVSSLEYGRRGATRNDPPPSAVKRSGIDLGKRHTISRIRSAFPSEFCC